MEFMTQKILQSIEHEGETTGSGYYPVALAVLLPRKGWGWKGIRRKRESNFIKIFMIDYVLPESYML